MYKYLLSFMIFGVGSVAFGSDLQDRDYFVIRDKQNPEKFVYQGTHAGACDGIGVAPYRTYKNLSIVYRAAVIEYTGAVFDTSEIDVNGKEIHEALNLDYAYLANDSSVYADLKTAFEDVAKIAAIYAEVQAAKDELADKKS